LTFCGDLLLCPLVVTFTRLRAVRRKGVNEHGGADVQGRGFARAKIYRGRLDSKTVLVSAPAKGLKGVKKPGKE
jgi:hypothetical protein